MRALRIRSGSGLGDSLYLRPVAEWWARNGGRPVEALSFYPDVFRGAAGVRVAQFERENVDIVAHYSPRKREPGTSQWQDVCRAAGIRVPLPLAFRWSVTNGELVSRVRAAAKRRPVVLVHGGREPFGRRDQFGLELLPDPRAFEAARAGLAECFTVRVGRGPTYYTLRTDLDLYGRTSIAELLDLAYTCDGIVAQCSFAVPMAEAFDKPLLAIWARRGLESKNRYISCITPAKVLQGERSRHIVDDAPESEVAERVAALVEEAQHEKGAALA